jgi:hypothetical protein
MLFTPIYNKDKIIIITFNKEHYIRILLHTLDIANIDQLRYRFCLDKTKHCNLSYSFFDYDYPAMKKEMQSFCRELTEFVFHHKRIFHLCNKYLLDLEEYIDIIS